MSFTGIPLSSVAPVNWNEFIWFIKENAINFQATNMSLSGLQRDKGISSKPPLHVITWRSALSLSYKCHVHGRRLIIILMHKAWQYFLSPVSLVYLGMSLHRTNLVMIPLELRTIRPNSGIIIQAAITTCEHWHGTIETSAEVIFYRIIIGLTSAYSSYREKMRIENFIYTLGVTIITRVTCGWTECVTWDGERHLLMTLSDKHRTILVLTAAHILQVNSHT